MSADSLFSLAGLLALPGWALLIFLPRWRYSATLVSGLLIPAILSALYAAIIIPVLLSGMPDFGSLGSIRALFQDDYLLLAGWVHYLAFDLFIGAWEVRDAQRHEVHHLAVVPCLLLTFMAGPVGLLLYLLIRAGWKRQYLVGNPA